MVVGWDLRNWDTREHRNRSMQALASKATRVVQYVKLLSDARTGYREYLDAQHGPGAHLADPERPSRDLVLKLMNTSGH